MDNYQTRCSWGCAKNTFVIHSFINSVLLLLRIFKTLSIPNRKSWEAEIQREWSTPTMCHIVCVTYHMSCVTCKIFFLLLFSPLLFEKGWSQSVEGLLSTGPTRLIFTDLALRARSVQQLLCPSVCMLNVCMFVVPSP